MEIALPDLPNNGLCQCASLSRLIVHRIESGEDSSLLDRPLVVQLCARALRIYSTARIHLLRNEENHSNITRIIHADWCRMDFYGKEDLIFDNLTARLKKLKQTRENASKQRKEKQKKQQSVELVDRSAIYLKQSLWFAHSVSQREVGVKNVVTDELDQLIYGNTPLTTIEATRFAGTRFEVSAISRHGNRFAMHNAVDIGFGHQIPDCDREVHVYSYENASHRWKHMGCDTSHYWVQSRLSYYSTHPQYQLIVQFGYLTLPFLQDACDWLPFSLLFEIICYAAPLNSVDNREQDKCEMGRFSPDLRIPNLLQFQRYLWLQTASADQGKNESQAVPADSNNSFWWNDSVAVVPYLTAQSRRTNTKRAFESVPTNKDVKFDASEYNPACWSKFWIWGSDELLRAQRISTPSHLKLTFSCLEEGWIRRFLEPVLSQCAKTSATVLQFLTQVVPRYAKIEQAENGVWYIFPGGTMDLQTVDAKIDEFLLENGWTYRKNPKESIAKAKSKAKELVGPKSNQKSVKRLR